MLPAHYATFRLMEGIDVYFLAKQMGTSVQMIEKHYGHITPSKNAGPYFPRYSGMGTYCAESDGDISRSVNAQGDGTRDLVFCTPNQQDREG